MRSPLEIFQQNFGSVYKLTVIIVMHGPSTLDFIFWVQKLSSKY